MRELHPGANFWHAVCTNECNKQRSKQEEFINYSKVETDVVWNHTCRPERARATRNERASRDGNGND